jgi:hypothetical protein
MYTDDEILAVHALYPETIPFARAIERGERAPAPIPDELRAMMALTDAWQADGYGHGAGRDGYWRSVIRWKGPIGPVRAEQAFGFPATRLVFEVTDLARQWQDDPLGHFGIGFTTSNLDVTFHSRQAADPLVRPRLLINDQLAIDCLADVSLAGSTTKNLGGAATLKLAYDTPALLRFARIPDDVVIERAMLVLTVVKIYGSGKGSVRLIEVVPPVEFRPATIADIYGASGNYFESASVGADPAASPYEKHLNHQVQNPAEWKKSAWPVEDGERHLRGYLNSNKQGNSWAIPIVRGHTLGTSDPTEGRTVHLRFECRVAPNFTRAVKEGGKWPGFSSAGDMYSTNPLSWWPHDPGNKMGVLFAGNGGGKTHGFDGWSARGGWYPRISGAGHPATGAVPLHTYAYYQRCGSELYHEIFRRYEAANGLPVGSQNYTISSPAALYALLEPGETLYPGVSGTGRVFQWDHAAPSGLLIPGRWHRIDQVMRINDPTQANGWLDAYVDGRQVGKMRDVAWRNAEPKWPKTSTLGIANAWMNYFQGGTSAYRQMTEETYIDTRRVALRVLEWDLF